MEECHGYVGKSALYLEGVWPLTLQGSVVHLVLLSDALFVLEDVSTPKSGVPTIHP